MTPAIQQLRDTLPNLLEQRISTSEDRFPGKLRRDASEAFARLGFPSPRHEEWRYLNVTPLASVEYRAPQRETAAPELPPDVTLREIALAELVFVDGIHAPALSTLPSLPAGLTIATMVDVHQRPGLVESHLALLAAHDEHPFAALNTGLMEDLAFVHIADGVVIDRPIHIVFLATDHGIPVVSSTRLLVVAGRASQATLVETYHGNGGSYLTNAVTEIFAGDGSVIDHYRLEREAITASHIGNVRIRLDRNAAVRSFALSLGGALVRNEVAAVLDGEGADCTLHGLYLATGGQKIDNHTTVDHARPHTNSVELYKGIVDGKANGIFEGKVIVRKDAQKITSSQTNNNLVLSRHAVADSKPQLEIHADDVKCSHGSTIGQLDEAALFYLLSRGIGRDQAENLLTFGFAGELIEKVKIESLRRQLELCLLERVPHPEEAI